MRRVVGGDRHRRVGANQPAHAAHVDDDVVADLDAPVVREGDQIGQRRTVRLVRRVELEQQLARLLEVLLQRLDLRREEIGPRACDDDDRRLVRYGALLSDDHFLDRVVLAAERRGDGVVAVAVGRDGVLFAVALREIDLPLLPGDHLDDAVGELLLVIRRHALGAAFVVEDDGPVLLNLILLRQRRLLVRIDVLRRHLLRHVLVFLELVPVARKLRFLREHEHLQRRIELREHVAALIRQAELLADRQVPALVLPRPDVVDRDEDPEDDEHARRRQRAVPRLAP